MRQLVACNGEIQTSIFCRAVYDRPQSRNCDIVGGHRPPLQKENGPNFTVTSH